MIGIILAGYGDFAKGLYSDLSLLAGGKPEAMKCVGFSQEDATDDFEYKLKDAIKDLDDCESILMLVDATGHAPYRTTLEVKKKYATKKDIEIVAGVNVGMLVSINLARAYVSSLSDLADMAVEEGVKNVVRYVPSEYDDE